ncbi:spore coat U domain-containing protein [Sphingobium sp. WCS2017Hpa-17]|uniref:Csu type fimbrial protein n=1 Tax=Sphingobium sp. WCS2017Hpa-17 TaxID=3073638 RepID=UPI00288A2D28|nr:spore coat U domain-containing protein [Sphingobium sp. WCS2017Hpa-17]
MGLRFYLGMIALPVSAVTLPAPAQAACDILALCTCTVSATGVDFGTYNPVSIMDNDSSGTVRVRCSLVLALAGSYTIQLSRGSSATYAQRSMASGASTLHYNLYTSNARNQIWGDGTGGSLSVTNTFTALLGVDQTTTVYGRVPAGQNVAPGGYSDTILVTIIF